MDAIQLFRDGFSTHIRRDHGMPAHEPTYNKRQAQAAGLLLTSHVGNDGRGVENGTWHRLQNYKGVPYYITGYDAVGDTCHPLYDPANPTGA